MRELSKRCLRLILLATIPLAALLAIFAADLTSIIFGGRADGAAPVLAMLAPLAVVRGVTSMWMGHCVAIGEEHRAAVAKARAAVAFFVMASSGILALGPMGLAIAAVLAEVLLAWQLRRLLASQEQSDPVWPSTRGVIVAAACAAMVAACLPSLVLPVRAMLVIGTMAFATALFGGVHGHDLRFLVAILRGDGRPGATGSSVTRK
jgi:O-antigen/teichoic acid export membrane protein